MDDVLAMRTAVRALGSEHREGLSLLLGVSTVIAMRDQDRGTGDVRRFPAEELEKLYELGEAIPPRIRGEELNKILNTQRFVRNAWYRVTEKGPRRLW